MTDAGERLQKYLASAGIASRRKAEDLIARGQVRVNGQVVSALGSRVRPGDRVEVGGESIAGPAEHVYILLNKPIGVVTTAQDEFGRQTVLDLVDAGTRVYPVGRLDFDAEGLLLLTNDGTLASGLTHPAGEVPKTYLVKVAGLVEEAAIERMILGVLLEDGPARAVQVDAVKVGNKTTFKNTWLRVVVTEGRNHLVKRLCAAVGHPVIRLKRIQLADLLLGNLQPGEWRFIEGDELNRLKSAANHALARRAHDSRARAGAARRVRRTDDAPLGPVRPVMSPDDTLDNVPRDRQGRMIRPHDGPGGPRSGPPKGRGPSAPREAEPPRSGARADAARRAPPGRDDARGNGGHSPYGGARTAPSRGPARDEDRGPRTAPRSAPAGDDRGPRTAPRSAPAGDDRGPRTAPRSAPAGDDRGPRTAPRSAPSGDERAPRTGPGRAPAVGRERRPGDERPARTGPGRPPVRVDDGDSAWGQKREGMYGTGGNPSRGPGRGAGRDDDAGPSRAPGRGADRDEDRGPSRGPGRGEDRGQGRGPGRGEDRGQGRGPGRGEDRGQGRGPSRGPGRDEDRGSSRGPSRGPQREGGREGGGRSDRNGPPPPGGRGPARSGGGSGRPAGGGGSGRPAGGGGARNRPGPRQRD